MVKEEYRVRSSRTVQFELETIEELQETNTAVVEIDGMEVGFDLDEKEGELPDGLDYYLTLDKHGPERLLSGFSSCFFSVLDGYDLTILAEGDVRFDGERGIVDEAGGHYPECLSNDAPDPSPPTQDELDVPEEIESDEVNTPLSQYVE